MSLPLVVGAYATMPADRPNQEKLYARIFERGLGTALEIPDAAIRGVSAEDFDWLTKQVGSRYVDSVITTIPTTMGMQGKLPGFGLASHSPDGRTAALSFINEVRQAAEKLNQQAGAQVVSAIHIHSAPSITADLDQFKMSLAELAGGDWSTRLVIEHCDAFSNQVPGEKRFLSLEDEMDAAASAGLGITVNWGRSVIESHDAATPLEHLEKLVDAGLLEGLMFSGAGDAETVYGGSWADAHLPLASDEPASWLTADRVRECLNLAAPSAKYLGVKIQTPAERSVDERLDFVESIATLIKN